jgi:hypothetical protein
MKNEQIAKDLAICEYVENSVIPILIDYNDIKTGKCKAGIHGTGTLFKFIDKYFLITAAHVLKQTEDYDEYIGIPKSNKSTELIALNNCTRYYPEDDKLSDIFDIGIILLSESHGKLIEKYYCFLNELDIQFKVKQEMNIFISAYPNSWGKLNNSKYILLETPFRFMSKLKIPEIKNYEVNPEIHILAEYSDMYYAGGDENKPRKAEQKLEGISGASMWAFEDNQSIIWTAKKCLKVIGIQCSLLEAKYIKGTKCVYLIDVFKYLDRDIYNLLFECYKKQVE